MPEGTTPRDRRRRLARALAATVLALAAPVIAAVMELTGSEDRGRVPADVPASVRIPPTNTPATSPTRRPA